MTLIPKRFPKRVQDTLIGKYSATVPFRYECFMCEHTLTSNDELVPELPANIRTTATPVPGNGAIYRLIGDGTHTPTFNELFVKAGGSADYDNTEDAVNLITFLFDGVAYWYSIVQPATE